MTDITHLVMVVAQSVLIFALAQGAWTRRPALKVLLIAGGLTMIVYAGAVFFGGMKVVAPVSFWAGAFWFVPAFVLQIAATFLMVRRGGAGTGPTP